MIRKSSLISGLAFMFRSGSLGQRTRALCALLALLLLPIGIASAGEPATITLTYRATLSYDGQQNANHVARFKTRFVEIKNGQPGSEFDRLWLAPGDQVKVELKDAGKQHLIGTWHAVVKYRANSVIGRQPVLLRGGKPEWEKTNPPRKVKVRQKVGEGRITVIAKIEPEHGDAKEHRFSSGRAIADNNQLGIVTEPTELLLFGTVDRRKPRARDFTKDLKDGKLESNITETSDWPTKGVWYELIITITRVQAP